MLSSSALGETRIEGHLTEGDCAVLSKHEVSQVNVNMLSCDANPLTLVVYCLDLRSLRRCFRRLNAPTAENSFNVFGGTTMRRTTHP